MKYRQIAARLDDRRYEPRQARSRNITARQAWTAFAAINGAMSCQTCSGDAHRTGSETSWASSATMTTPATCSTRSRKNERRIARRGARARRRPLRPDSRNAAWQADLSQPTRMAVGNTRQFSLGLSGQKRGLWHDHEVREGGDIIALVQRECGCDFSQAIDWSGRDNLASLSGRPAMRPPAMHRPSARASGLMSRQHRHNSPTVDFPRRADLARKPRSLWHVCRNLSRLARPSPAARGGRRRSSVSIPLALGQAARRRR